MRLDKNYYITWFIKLPVRTNFPKPFRDLPDTFRDSVVSAFPRFFLFSPFGKCVYGHQVSPGSQIALFGKCSFWIPSGFLPDFTRD